MRCHSANVGQSETRYMKPRRLRWHKQWHLICIEHADTCPDPDIKNPAPSQLPFEDSRHGEVSARLETVLLCSLKYSPRHRSSQITPQARGVIGNTFLTLTIIDHDEHSKSVRTSPDLRNEPQLRNYTLRTILQISRHFSRILLTFASTSQTHPLPFAPHPAPPPNHPP